MPAWFFASDLHGDPVRYRRLWERVAAERPAAVLLGGDLFPSGRTALASLDPARTDFIDDYLVVQLERLRERMAGDYPRVLLILGNDDPRVFEAAVLAAAARGTWEYVHERRVRVGDFEVYGYGCVPPTPFQLKDWERYDVSRYVEPGCVSPEEGLRTIPVPEHETRHGTIAADLARLTEGFDAPRSVMLFHAPPADTDLDRAALDNRFVDHVPLNVHVGSIALRRFIEQYQPRVTLHGHIHESARLTGRWSQRLGRTWCFSAAHDGPELALVRFDPQAPDAATRELL